LLILTIRILWQIARDVADDVPHLSPEDVAVRPVLQMWQYQLKAVPFGSLQNFFYICIHKEMRRI